MTGLEEDLKSGNAWRIFNFQHLAMKALRICQMYARYFHKLNNGLVRQKPDLEAGPAKNRNVRFPYMDLK